MTNTTVTIAPADWLDKLTTATARVAELERANAGHHSLEDTQTEVIRDLQTKLQQANAKAGHHALGDVQIENIADDYENAYKFVVDERDASVSRENTLRENLYIAVLERDALQHQLAAMKSKVEETRAKSFDIGNLFSAYQLRAISRWLDAIRDAGEVQP